MPKRFIRQNIFTGAKSPLSIYVCFCGHARTCQCALECSCMLTNSNMGVHVHAHYVTMMLWLPCLHLGQWDLFQHKLSHLTLFLLFIFISQAINSNFWLKYEDKILKEKVNVFFPIYVGEHIFPHGRKSHYNICNMPLCN